MGMDEPTVICILHELQDEWSELPAQANRAEDIFQLQLALLDKLPPRSLTTSRGKPSWT